MVCPAPPYASRRVKRRTSQAGLCALCYTECSIEIGGQCACGKIVDPLAATSKSTIVRPSDRSDHITTFVHLTTDKRARSIKRAGISCDSRGGFYAMPVTANFVATHQWMRELRRFQNGRACYIGIYFRLPDDDVVRVGRYNQPHCEMSAAAAAKLIATEPEPFGFEVIVPHALRPSAITKIRVLPQGIGWRYFPAAHGSLPVKCMFPCCMPLGTFGARRLRERYANLHDPAIRLNDE